jgi:hypothetical protein
MQTPRKAFFPADKGDYVEQALAAIIVNLFGVYATHHGWT